MENTLDVERIQKALDLFAVERQWDQFHNPKNLACALSVEASELLELFQWLTPEESLSAAKPGELKRRATEELADILIYSLRLAHKLHIRLSDAIDDKLRRNSEKYPVALSKGNATKYSDL